LAIFTYLMGIKDLDDIYSKIADLKEFKGKLRFDPKSQILPKKSEIRLKNPYFSSFSQFRGDLEAI